MKRETFENESDYAKQGGKSLAVSQVLGHSAKATFFFLLKVLGVVMVLGAIVWGCIYGYGEYKAHSFQSEEQVKLHRDMKFQSIKESTSHFYLEGDATEKQVITLSFARGFNNTYIMKDDKIGVYTGFDYTVQRGVANKFRGEGEQQIIFHYAKCGMAYMLEIDGYRYLANLISLDEFKKVYDGYKPDVQKEALAQYNEVAALIGKPLFKPDNK